MPDGLAIGDRGVVAAEARKKRRHESNRRIFGVGESMKKVLAGCLIVLVIASIGFAAAGYYAYRAMKPVIDNASSYMDKAREVSRLGEDINNKTPFEPPANGELTQTQVER